MRWPLWLTRVEAGSMAPTLVDGQLVWTRALSPRTQVRRGDLVVFDSHEVGRRILKRIIGLPGEQVELRSGQVFIDGAALDEPYATPSFFKGHFEVPAEHFFLLGDHRDASTDSRSWSQPYIQRSQLVGRLLLRRVTEPPVPGANAGRLTSARRP